MQQQRYLLGEVSKGRESTIVMGKDGYPLFWKSWPALMKEAWLIRLRKRVNERLGFNLQELVADVVAKIKADQRAKKPTQRELYAQWDREALLAAALNGAVQNLQAGKARAVAPIRRTK